jgi:hypothetical protein
VHRRQSKKTVQIGYNEGGAEKRVLTWLSGIIGSLLVVRLAATCGRRGARMMTAIHPEFSPGTGLLTGVEDEAPDDGVMPDPCQRSGRGRIVD